MEVIVDNLNEKHLIYLAIKEWEKICNEANECYHYGFWPTNLEKLIKQIKENTKFRSQIEV